MWHGHAGRLTSELIRKIKRCHGVINRPREVHTATIKFRNAAPSLAADAPGPGEYDTQPRRSHSDGKTFGGGWSHAGLLLDSIRSSGGAELALR